MTYPSARLGDESEYPTISDSRNGRCPQRYWSCDSAGRCVRQSRHAGNQEGAEAAGVPDPQGTVGFASAVPAEAIRVAQAAFPTLVAAGPSSRVLAEGCFDDRHTIRECRCHGPCSNARLGRRRLRACCALFRVRCLVRVWNWRSAQENLAQTRTSTLEISFHHSDLNVLTSHPKKGGPETCYLRPYLEPSA